LVGHCILRKIANNTPFRIGFRPAMAVSDWTWGKHPMARACRPGVFSRIENTLR
jgi:hypothetical protein